MKKILSTTFIASLLFLTACASQAPMTEEEQAAHYGLSVEKFREEKKAAARMNMGLEEHMQMLKDGHDMHHMMDH